RIDDLGVHHLAGELRRARGIRERPLHIVAREPDQRTVPAAVTHHVVAALGELGDELARDPLALVPEAAPVGVEDPFGALVANAVLEPEPRRDPGALEMP